MNTSWTYLFKKWIHSFAPDLKSTYCGYEPDHYLALKKGFRAGVYSCRNNEKNDYIFELKIPILDLDKNPDDLVEKPIAMHFDKCPTVEDAKAIAAKMNENNELSSIEYELIQKSLNQVFIEKDLFAFCPILGGEVEGIGGFVNIQDFDLKDPRFDLSTKSWSLKKHKLNKI